MTAPLTTTDRPRRMGLHSLLRLFLLVPLGLPLAADSGGQSPADRAKDPAIEASFIDAPTVNLGYRGAIEGISRRTGDGEDAGGLQCLPGDVVTFFIGDIELGVAPCAAGTVYPTDIRCGLADPQRAEDCAVNIAMFLQAHAPDGADVIVISERSHADAAGVQVDFTLPRGAFEAQFYGDGPPGRYMRQRARENGRPDDPGQSGLPDRARACEHLSENMAERGDNGHAPDCSKQDVEARAVVAVIDTGINVYHQFFHEGSPIYPEGTPPSAVTQEVLDEFGIGPECIIQLTRTGAFAADFAADVASGEWEKPDRCEVVWFAGTNVLARSFVPGTTVILPDDEGDTHGLSTSAAVLKANPEAIVLFLEGLANTDAERFAFSHPAVDFVSTSYGFIGGIPLPGHITDSFSGTHLRGKLHFGACDNTPSAAPHDGTCGPWWSVGISGFEERDEDFQEGGDQPASHGRQVTSGTLPDFISDFTQVLPNCRNCEDGYGRFVAGTSFAAPRSAGVASRILLEARRALGHAGGIFVSEEGPPEAPPLMAAGEIDGQAIAVTNWQMRRALEEAAWIPALEEYDPEEGVFDFFGVPIPEQAPWTVAGWGVISPLFGNVVAETLARLGIAGEPERAKSAEHCDFQTLVIEGRKAYWDFVDSGSETFLNPPEPDPFVFCEQGQLR